VRRWGPSRTELETPLDEFPEAANEALIQATGRQLV